MIGAGPGGATPGCVRVACTQDRIGATDPGREKVGGTAEHGYRIADRTAPAISSRWCTTASSTASWPAREGLNILKNANIGNRPRDVDAETTLLRDPEYYYNMDNIADVAELAPRQRDRFAWLLDLLADALLEDLQLLQVRGSRLGSGKDAGRSGRDRRGRSRSRPVVGAVRALLRGDAEFADKLLSAMRHEFGGHLEKHRS